MDITQHLAVLGRWRKVILASVFLGLILAALFTIKVPPKDGKIDWRRPEKWQSTSRILVTQSGFPWGRTTLPGGATTGTDLSDPVASAKKTDPSTPDYADPSRLSLLAIIYSFISQSNTINDIGGHKLPPGGTVSAIPLENQRAGALPLIEVTTTGYTRQASDALNNERTKALAAYLENQQDVNDVPVGQRVRLAVLNRPEATMVSSHGLVLGLAMIFLTLSAGIAASYVLESLRLSRVNGVSASSGELVTHPTRTTSTSLTDAPKRNVR